MTSVQRLTPGAIGSIRHESVSILGARSFVLKERNFHVCQVLLTYGLIVVPDSPLTKVVAAKPRCCV